MSSKIGCFPRVFRAAAQAVSARSMATCQVHTRFLGDYLWLDLGQAYRLSPKCRPIIDRLRVIPDALIIPRPAVASSNVSKLFPVDSAGPEWYSVLGINSTASPRCVQYSLARHVILYLLDIDSQAYNWRRRGSWQEAVPSMT